MPLVLEIDNKWVMKMDMMDPIMTLDCVCKGMMIKLYNGNKKMDPIMTLDCVRKGIMIKLYNGNKK